LQKETKNNWGYVNASTASELLFRRRKIPLEASRVFDVARWVLVSFDQSKETRGSGEADDRKKVRSYELENKTKDSILTGSRVKPGMTAIDLQGLSL
jgi:hypothetical protein